MGSDVAPSRLSSPDPDPELVRGPGAPTPGRWVWAREALTEHRDPAQGEERARLRHRGASSHGAGAQAPGGGPSAGHVSDRTGRPRTTPDTPGAGSVPGVEPQPVRVTDHGDALVDVPPVPTPADPTPPSESAPGGAVPATPAAPRPAPTTPDGPTAGGAPAHDGPDARSADVTSPDIDLRIGAYEDLLLGGRPCLTAREMAARTGTPLGRVDEFWLAMGFPTAGADEVAFTVRDLEAYRAWSTLIDAGAIDLATGRSLLRAQSHIADRLALWQVEALVEDVARRQDLDDSQARRHVLESMGDRIDFLEHALVYSWRRQLEALVARVDHEVSQRGPDSGKRRFPLTRSLGFVDMVSYTSSSAILGSRLVGLIERFEDASRTAVTAAGGRVVKMIGDAVLFIADDLTTGLRVVTSLIEALGADDQILPVRASFVRGDVFSRSGDVFGPPVNLASRLVDIAPEGRILTDPTTAAAIAGGKGGSGYHLEDFPSAELRGFGTVSPYLLARDPD